MVAVRVLHVLDDEGSGAALLAAETSEGHLQPLHVAGGGDQAVGAAPEQLLVQQPELADDQVGGGRELGDGQHLEAMVQRVAVGLGVGDGLGECIQVGRGLVGEGGDPGQVGGVEARGAAEVLHGRGEVVRRLDPALGERLGAVGLGEQVPVGVDTRSARLEGGRFGSNPFELREHECVLAAGRAVVGGPELLVDRAQLGSQRGDVLLLAERVLQLLGDLLERGPGLAELGRLVRSGLAGDHAEVGGLHEHEGAERLGGGGEAADRWAGGGAVVVVPGHHCAARVAEEVDDATSAVDVAEGGRLTAAGQRPEDALGQRLALGRAKAAQHGHTRMELDPQLVAGDLQDQLIEAQGHSSSSGTSAPPKGTCSALRATWPMHSRRPSGTRNPVRPVAGAR